MWRKIAFQALTVLFTLGFFVFSGFISIVLPATSRHFYQTQFEKYNTLYRVQGQSIYLDDMAAAVYVDDLSEEELLDLMDHTMRYCLFLEDDLNPTIDGVRLEIFRPDEYAHMEDVRGVFGGGLLLVGIFFLFIPAGLIFGLKFKKAYFDACRRIPYYTLLTTACLLLAVGLFAAIDFDAAFTLFHEIFFAGTQWRFANGVMITMIGPIFTDIVPIIFVLWSVLLGTFLACLVFYNCYLKKRFSSTFLKP